jgi:hypothetical protein
MEQGMPRKIRVEYPGAIYHIMSRGDRQEDIFHDEYNRIASYISSWFDW